MTTRFFDDGSECIFCRQPIADPDPAPEHVLHAGLGGRLEATRLICNECNHAMGDTIDRDFVESLAPIRNLLQIASIHRGHPPRILSSDPNAAYIIGSDGVPQYRAQRAAEVEPDGTHRVQTLTSNPSTSMNMLLQELRGRDIITNEQFNEYSDAFISLGGDTNALIQVIERLKDLIGYDFCDIETGSGYPEPLPTSELLSSDNIRRAVAKVLFEYFALQLPKDLTLSGHFDLVREYIRYGHHADNCFTIHDYDFVKPHADVDFIFPNTVWIICDPDVSSVTGFLTLFGDLSFSTLLSSTWTGEKICYYWASNPKGPEYTEQVFNDISGKPSGEYIFPQDDDERLAMQSRSEQAYRSLSLKSALEHLSEKFQEGIDDIKRSLRDYNYREMTEEQQLQITGPILGRIAEFIESRQGE